MKNLQNKPEDKVSNGMTKTKKVYDFLIQDPTERLKRAGSDMMALGLINFVAFGTLETIIGQLPLTDIAEQRVLGFLTSPVLGLVRDYDRQMKGIDIHENKKLETKIDFKAAAKVAGTELGINLIKYMGQKYFKGEPIRAYDFLLPGASALLGWRLGHIYGSVIETVRSGFRIDKKNNYESLFKNWSDGMKLTGSTAYSLAAIGAFTTAITIAAQPYLNQIMDYLSK